MGLKVASTSLHLSQPAVHHSPSSSHTLASAYFSPSKRRSSASCDGALFCRHAERAALFLGAQQSSNLLRSRSLHSRKSKVRIIRRALTASLDSFSDEDFSKQIEELAQKFQINQESDESLHKRLGSSDAASGSKFLENLRPFDPIEPPDFPERDEIIPANIERKANSVEIPLSLRMIKRKKQWQEGLMEAGESACCSVKRAFSSMVFIIRELHSFTLQMREVLFYEDLRGILENVQREMHASFVWLFEKVFSHTPTLMVSVMILLANYSVYSMSSNAAIAASLGVQPYAVTSTVVEDNNNVNNDAKKFDPSVVRTMNLASSSSSNSGKSASVEGNTGGGSGGRNYKVAGSGMDGDGRFDGSNYDRTITPSGPQSVGTSGTESSRVEEETALWDLFVEEASEISGGEVLDQDSVGSFVSPIHAKIESDDYSDYSKMDMLYQTQLYHEPENSLLLANYAQFLYLVAQDYDRAEDYFKRAIKAEPRDAESFNKYASFLWQVRKDLWAAEETYLEAIDTEPDNSYYSANYAHFLWNTGGEDTCFPLNSPDSSTEM